MKPNNCLVFGVCLFFLLQCVASASPPCGGKGISEVSLQKVVISTHGDNYFHECTGSIISENWVLTAANCFNAYGDMAGSSMPHKWRVVANEMDLREVSGKEQIRNVKRIVRPRGFAGRASPRDVALVELASAIDFADGVVTPVCLPENVEEERKLTSGASHCAILGWGLDMATKYDPKLQKMPIPIRDETTCRRFYGDLALKGICFDCDREKFCRDDINAFVKPWGSPILCAIEGGEPIITQIGVLNWAATDQPCYSPVGPPIFTKALFLREWIRQIANV